MSGNINALIVDDLPRTRQSIRALLATWPRLASALEAASADEALGILETSPIDVVLMDVRMSGMDGLEATRHIKARWPRVRVIVLSMYSEYADRAVSAGADSFVSKIDPAERLLAELERVVDSL